MDSPASSQALVGIEIHGGLGNQMFQYAAAYALAKRHNAELRLDTRYVRRKDALRPLGLQQFGLAWNECQDPASRGIVREIARFFGHDRNNPFRGAVFREGTGASFEDELAARRLPLFLHGYFQSTRYLVGAEADLRKIFDTRRFAGPKTTPYRELISRAANPVMVHLRRGDFVAIGSTVSVTYYERARAILESRVKEPAYFIFSDDPEAAKEVFKSWPDAHFVIGLTDVQDLYLMTLCHHHILSNSTFCWWGAWLSGATASLAIAPHEGPDNAGRFPKDWIVLDTLAGLRA